MEAVTERFSLRFSLENIETLYLLSALQEPVQVDFSKVLMSNKHEYHKPGLLESDRRAINRTPLSKWARDGMHVFLSPERKCKFSLFHVK